MKGNEYLIDIHSHIVFNVDDGARNLEESLKLIDMAMGQGIKKIIATPHTMPNLKPEEIIEKINIIRSKIHERDMDCEIYTGQEIFYSCSAIEKIKKGEYLTLANSKYILVEFEPAVSFSYLKRATRDIIFAGYIPIFAHVERYICLRKSDRFTEIMAMGALFQMNYGSIKGGIFDIDAYWCKRQIKNGYISFMATDMHRIGSREPDIANALRWLSKGVEKHFREITYDNANNIILNK